MDGEQLYEEVVRRRFVVVTGGSEWGRGVLVRQLDAAVPREFFIRVEDIGVEEPEEVTLLRLLGTPLMQGLFYISELGPTLDFPEALRTVCRQALSMLPIGAVILFNGARQPLLDTMRSLIDEAQVAVVAVNVPEEIPSDGYFKVSAEGDSPPLPSPLSTDARRLHEDLAALTTTGTLLIPYPLISAPSTSVAQLSEHHLAYVTNSGVRLHSSATYVTRDWSAERLRNRAVSVLTTLLRTAHPPLVRAQSWTYVLLAGRLLSLSQSESAQDLVRSLTTKLARSNHPLELMALWCYRSSSPVAPTRLDRRFVGAVREWEQGNLRSADELLAEIPDRRPTDGWLIHTRAAVACDRGDLRGVGSQLRRAIEAHQVAGDRQGEAWAMLYYGRWRLLSGDFDEAEKVIDAARVALQDVYDAVGVDWADAEQMRLHLLLGSAGFTDNALLDLGTPPQQAWGNQRSAVWADLFYALARAPARPYRAPLDLPDQLHAAWSRHFTIIGVWRSPTAPLDPAELFANIQAFARLGCPHGEAWAFLELAIRTPRPLTGPHSFARARALFTHIGDEAGLAWTTLAQALAENDGPPPEALNELARRYPPTLLSTTEWPWTHGHFRIPFAARLLIPEPRYESAELRLPTTESKVRLTLHEDNRLTLQVVPGPHHPWSASSALPWLSARATPLTPADIEPSHAVTIRPGPPNDTDAGAEFHFTPHRPGHHRIRFTVEHQPTGTVLQEVETEFDVTDTPQNTLTGPTSLRRP